MQVQHPQADRDCPLPAAVTCPDGETRHPDSDGWVTAPDDVARALADAWAAHYGADADALLGADDADAGGGPADTCDAVKLDGEVCGRDLPCPYHTDDDTADADDAEA